MATGVEAVLCRAIKCIGPCCYHPPRDTIRCTASFMEVGGATTERLGSQKVNELIKFIPRRHPEGHEKGRFCQSARQNSGQRCCTNIDLRQGVG